MTAKSGPRATAEESKLAVLARHRAKKLGAGAPVCDSVEAINRLVKTAWDAAYTDAIPTGWMQKASHLRVPPSGKGSGEQFDSRMARPELVGSCAVIGTYAAVRQPGRHFDDAAADVMVFTGQ